ncbi:MAG: CXXX repeat peptide modification system protein [Clostridia bacterium]|nr:CXXX repeat peptide modification system protein [Clostridia bacterium]
MLREKVGFVTENEKSLIMQLYTKKKALEELFLTLCNPSLTELNKDSLYTKIVDDMGKTKTEFDKWWSDMSRKYQWKSCENKQWTIDFETSEIFLIEKPGI